MKTTARSHPTICLLCLLALAVAVHALSLRELAVIYALLLLGSVPRGWTKALIRSGWRLKYFLLALLISFGLLEREPLAGAHHALLLLVVAAAVQVQFLLHSAEACGAALTQLLSPLGAIREPLGRRLALTLAMVPPLLDGLRSDSKSAERDWVGALAAHVEWVENPQTVLPVELPELNWPAARDYWPLLIIGVLLGAMLS